MLEDFLKSISIVIFEAFCCSFFLDAFLEKKFSHRLASYIHVALLAGTFVVLANLTNFHGGMFIFRNVLIILSIFLLSMVFYYGKWQKKLFFSGAFYVLLYCVDYFSFIFLGLILEPDFLVNDVIQVIIALLCKTMLFIVVLAIRHFWSRGREVQMGGPSWILMICFPILSMVILLVMLFSFLGSNSAAGYLIISFGIMFMNIVMFQWLTFVSERDQQWNQIRLLQERNTERIQFYREASANYEEQKQIFHDYKNHIGCIQGLLENREYQEAEEYVEKMIGMLPKQMESVDVNNPIINVVLNQKYRLARMEGIAMIFYANDLADLWLEEQDIVSLISNLLDNAVEACEKLEEDRVIHIKMIREKSQFVISIRNPVSAPVRIENNVIQTDKQDKKRHGIGLKNVQMVLDKYQGMGMMRYEDGCFYYTAVVPELEK